MENWYFVNSSILSNANLQYFKHITIVNDTSRVVCEWCHNLEHYSFINYNPKRRYLHSFMIFIVQMSLMTIVIYLLFRPHSIHRWLFFCNTHRQHSTMVLLEDEWSSSSICYLRFKLTSSFWLQCLCGWCRVCADGPSLREGECPCEQSENSIINFKGLAYLKKCLHKRFCVKSCAVDP